MNARIHGWSSIHLPRSVLVVLAVTALAGACDDDDDDDRHDAGRVVDAGGGRDAGGRDAGDAAVAELTEPEVAGVIAAMNAGVGAQSTAVLATGLTDADVEAFATRMRDEHDEAQDAQTALLDDLDIAPRETELSQHVTTEADAVTTKLDGLAGGELDRAYVDAQVLMHAENLDVIQTRLLPSTTTERFRQSVIAFRDAEVAHLETARALQADLEGTPPVAP